MAASHRVFEVPAKPSGAKFVPFLILGTPIYLLTTIVPFSYHSGSLLKTFLSHNIHLQFCTEHDEQCTDEDIRLVNGQHEMEGTNLVTNAGLK